MEQYKAQNVSYERDIPILQETVGGVWKKGGRVEGAESGGRGVGAQDTAHARTVHARDSAGADRQRTSGKRATRTTAKNRQARCW